MTVALVILALACVLIAGLPPWLLGWMADLIRPPRERP